MASSCHPVSPNRFVVPQIPAHTECQSIYHHQCVMPYLGMLVGSPPWGNHPYGCTVHIIHKILFRKERRPYSSHTTQRLVSHCIETGCLRVWKLPGLQTSHIKLRMSRHSILISCSSSWNPTSSDGGRQHCMVEGARTLKS